MTLRTATAGALALALAGGCANLSDWQTAPGEVYAGTVVGTDPPDCMPEEGCSFLRRGFPAGTRLEMSFDPSAATLQPGSLTTVGELCGATFEAEPLLPIAPLAHDALGQYGLPGDGRVKNYLFALQPSSGPLGGRDAMAFVSLMEGEGLEVRIVAGPGTGDCAPDDCAAFAAGECDFFGLFRLGRERATSP
ncbi:MAG: hypothetical protein AAGH15_22940 [Myxococcota bacterium]